MNNNKIEGYHATTKKYAIEISETQKFKIDNEKANQKFLGRGIYFYLDRANAVDWTIKMYKDKKNKQLPNNPNEIIDNYRIITADIINNENRILNLDTRENINKLNVMADLIKQKLEKYSMQSNDKILGVILNYLEKNNFLEDIDAVKRTFPYPIESTKKIKGINCINKTMICVKNNCIIDNIKISKKITQKEYNYSMIIY